MKAFRIAGFISRMIVLIFVVVALVTENKYFLIPVLIFAPISVAESLTSVIKGHKQLRRKSGSITGGQQERTERGT